MKFSAEQIASLSAPLSRECVKTRSQSGRTLSYIEGWKAIAEANRIFGFDGWTRETIDLRCVAEKPRKVGAAGKDGWGVTYIARVRVMVGDLIREGCGTGHGIDVDLGQAHESALKEAETDAMKRSMMTFGNPFGLALYDKDQNEVADAAPTQREVIHTPKTMSRAQDQDIVDGMKNFCAVNKVQLTNCETVEDVQHWCELREEELKRLKKHSLEMWNDLRKFKEDRITTISQKEAAE